VVSLEKLSGGRNSRVYEVCCAGSARYAGKIYFRHNSDKRDRQGVEFSGLRFLWENGVRSIPRPIALDKASSIAVYEFVEGQEIASSKVTAAHIDRAVDFLVGLKQLAGVPGSEDLPPASEACFSVQAIGDNIKRRLERLSDAPSRGPLSREFHKFLENDLIPTFEEVIAGCKSTPSKSEISFSSDIGIEQRTLSPSDFGFHNALGRDDGGIVFLDFEYFGWDDPAKMLSDFLLHPAMELSKDLQRRFVQKILAGFEGDGRLPKRVETVFPLFGIKWCLILLNEFLPEQLSRRTFAGGSAVDVQALQAKQLARAKLMLKRFLNQHENFAEYYR